MSTDLHSVCLDGIIFGLQRNGGISNYWARLLSAFSASQAAGWRTVFPKEIIFQQFASKWRLGENLVEKMPAALSRYMACPVAASDGVMHTSYYRLPSRPVKRYVVTAYDFMYERYRSGPALWVHRRQKRQSIARADTVLCISDFTRRELLEFIPEADPRKIRVIPLGVDTDAFFPDRKDDDKNLVCTVLFVGLRAGYKRFALAVEAIQSASHLSLGLVGPPLTSDEIALLESRIRGRWHHFGSVSASRLRELYSSAYALIFPSDCEGFGLPVLESMACGCPVVASNRGSLPEVGGSAAHFAESQSAEAYSSALDALQNSDTRASTVSRGFDRVQSFSWNNTVYLTQEAYSIS
ncbi:MAG: glycosyltransferase family 4 protein [Polaromonas sp.]|nr:glycosyltransferase family 4 protein [Polaromonas sp.]